MNYTETIFKIQGFECKRITATRAKKLYDSGYTIFILPCKLRPENMYWSPHNLNKEFDGDFERFVNYYRAMNCNFEVGYNPSYYISKQDLENDLQSKVKKILEKQRKKLGIA
jgi:hypothetical protein